MWCLQCRLLSPSRIYKQQYQSIANKTKLVAACLQLVSSNASLSYDAVVRHLAEGVAVLPQGADPEALEYISDFDGHDTAEAQRFDQHDLLDHAAFVVQQVGPVLGRHALKVCCNYSIPVCVTMLSSLLHSEKLFVRGSSCPLSTSLSPASQASSAVATEQLDYLQTFTTGFCAMSMLEMRSWLENCMSVVLICRADCLVLVLQSFLVTLADRADLQLRDFIGTGISVCQHCLHGLNSQSSIMLLACVACLISTCFSKVGRSQKQNLESLYAMTATCLPSLQGVQMQPLAV